MDYNLGLIYKGILRNERLNGRFMQDSKVSRKEGDLRAVSQRLAGLLRLAGTVRADFEDWTVDAGVVSCAWPFVMCTSQP